MAQQERPAFVLDLESVLLCTVAADPSDLGITDIDSVKDEKDRPDLLYSEELATHIKLRPGVRDFLEAVHERYVLHIFSVQDEQYVSAVRRMLDPQGVLFNDARTANGTDLRKREDNATTDQKHLDVLGLRAFDTIVMDDSLDAWQDEKSRCGDDLMILKPRPYRFTPFGDANDTYLPMVRKFLLEAQSMHKDQPSTIQSKSIGTMCRSIIRQSFRGLTFSTIGEWEPQKLQALHEKIIAFGGSLEEDPDVIVIRDGHKMTPLANQNARAPAVKELWLTACFNEFKLHNPLPFFVAGHPPLTDGAFQDEARIVQTLQAWRSERLARRSPRLAKREAGQAKREAGQAKPEACPSAGSSSKRKRGQPVEAKPKASPSAGSSLKRKRGQPVKAKPKASPSSGSSSKRPAKRKRGRPAKSAPTGNPTPPSTVAAESEPEDVEHEVLPDLYVVEHLVKPTAVKGVASYFVKWRDYDEFTIEPRSNLRRDVPEVVELFEERQQVHWRKYRGNDTFKWTKIRR